MADQLPAKQRKAIATYTAVLQQNMRLHAWRITIAEQLAPKKRNVYAQIHMGQEAHEATIQIGSAFFKVPRAEQRLILCHELAHLVLEPVVWSIERNFKPIGAKGQADANLRPALETAVDDFGFLIAEHQPLPPKGWRR